MTLEDTWRTVSDRHAKRQFGRSGSRRVSLNVLTQGKSILTYLIDHIWEMDGQCCRSLMHLTQPAGIAGTSVLMVERPRMYEVDLWIKLNTSHRVLEVGRDKVLQHLLGTDFSYEDLRFWYPTDAVIVESATSVERPGGSAWQFAGKRLLPDSRCIRVEIEMRDDGELLATRQEILGDKGSDRIFRVASWQHFDGRFCPTEIAVARMAGSYVSKMNLHQVTYEVKIPQSLFDVASLAGMNSAVYQSTLDQPRFGSYLSTG
jgi:Outer membrane lipoprotein-sorting protein